jgi:hypothetical protein
VAQSPQDLRFAVECPACKAVYSLTADAIGKTAKCRCGHRFTVTGPHFATIPADRAFLCICPHCQARVVASKDAPRATVLCCRCGKTFQKQHTSPPPQSQLVGQPPGFVPSVPLATNSAISSTDSLEAGVRSTVAECTHPTQEYRHIGGSTVSVAASVGAAANAPQTMRSVPTVMAHQSRPWFTYQCPICSRHTAFIASEVNNEVQCALCPTRMRLQVADTCSDQTAAGDPELWMQCRCPRCRRRMAVDESHRGEVIYCPTCFESFTAPGVDIATSAPTFHYSPPSAAYSYRPLPVRSYRKKNGTWVHSYQRAQPRKRR